ncbi:SDR family NAD(P)-dependent oxidoreductase [Dactylosporangium sp. CA-092794]|uniref:SDR family NAD(P)-dependent oxidoreductase n=1 Tax=Dactylosporangium sp. CA-092794 TaxID=3239929 RepID=UPI003D9210B1
MTLSGKVVLVTGATRGLGRAMAGAYAAAGMTVVVSSRDEAACRRTAEELTRESGARAVPIACHVGRWDELDRLVEHAYDQTGRVDVLVNNAGSAPTYPSMAAISEELFDKTIAVNLKGPLRLGSLVGARMVEQGGGSIINITSTAALRPRPDVAVYAAAKAGLEVVTIALARAYAPSVRVNSIMAGPFATDVAAYWDMDVVGPRLRSYPAGRAGEPAEIIGAALYLADDVSSFTTGSVIRVDGGMAIA